MKTCTPKLRPGWIPVALAVLVNSLALVPARADAQRFVATSTTNCAEVVTTPGPCTGTCPSGEFCANFDGGVHACLPNGALFCVPPVGSGECPPARPELFSVPGWPFDLCVSSGVDTCVPRLPSCFTASGVPHPVDHPIGDCDGDGLRNSIDPRPCVEAPRFTPRPDGSCTRLTACVANSDCAERESCVDLDGDPDGHAYCVLDGETSPTLCCRNSAGGNVCLGGSCAAPGAGPAFCQDPGYCPSWPFADRASCVWRDGRNVGPDEGDCDGDGLPNDEDPLPCEAGGAEDAGPADAGPADAGLADAGPADAGPGDDAGSEDAGPSDGLDAGDAGTMDAGTMDADVTHERMLTFGGGGGGRCGVRPTRRGGLPMALGLALALVWRGRRRS
ncbi:MAG: hypothetical protein AB8I08_33665 [Sandaracinaceae bacterium]